jgi:hypothetical protein
LSFADFKRAKSEQLDIKRGDANLTNIKQPDAASDTAVAARHASDEMPVELGRRGHQAGQSGPEQHGCEIERTPVGAAEPTWVRLIEAPARVSPTAATQHPSRVAPLAYTIRAPWWHRAEPR